jgi:hypothetical protein
MSQAPPTPAPAADDASTRFLVELENAWTLLRLYGTEHPAFKRGAEAAAAAIERPARVSINPRGFSPSNPGVGVRDTLRVFAHKLRSMGLVGLTMEPGLTPAQVLSLVNVLSEADRSRGSADAVVEKIAAATGGRVRAVPLRLDGLKLIEGMPPGPDEAANGDVWHEIFAGAFLPGADTEASAELAHAFEAALGGQSSAQWDVMVGVWMKQLASIDPERLRTAAAGEGSGGVAEGTGPGGTGSLDGAHAGATQPSPARRPRTAALDSVATFLSTLSPVLCQKLLTETISGQAVSEPVVLAIADRLPAGVVLGALAAVDRSNGSPPTAALALLRKMSANVPGAAALAADANPTTRAELAEVASTLERLLRTNQEHQFVPEEYLQRRQELSAHALSADQARALSYPGEADTARHAATLAFDILAAPESSATELSSSLSFVTDRIGGWIRAGDFALARDAISVAAGLVAHAEPAVSKAAQALVSASVNADDLLEGAGRRTDRAAAVTELAALLRQSDGTTLATLLSSMNPTAGDPVLEAFQLVLAELSDKTLQGLFRAISTTPPPSLLAVLTGLREAEALKAVAAILPHASGPVRRAAAHVVFRRDFRWPLPLIDQLLCDEEPEVRRLAVMKLVSDADLATAANVLGAASKAGKYEADVALGLAELLRRHRNHPDVRPGWRQWTWSKRWWAALLFVNIGTPRRAA